MSARRFGRSASFAEIAEREAQGERHIRLLAPLAFLSPCIIAAIVDGTAPADLTVTGLAKAVPYCRRHRSRRHYCLKQTQDQKRASRLQLCQRRTRRALRE